MTSKDFYGLAELPHEWRYGVTTALYQAADECWQLGKAKKYAQQWIGCQSTGNRVTILGLGDVGRTLALGLKVLASEAISEIGLYDLNQQNLARVEMELSQIYSATRRDIPVVKRQETALFDCDVFIFTASQSVPALGQAGEDVRLAQLHSNAQLVEAYVDQAIAQQFNGLFAIVSDPVDLLCKVALARIKARHYRAMSPLQVRGFGLGVMHARARYFAALKKLPSLDDKLHSFGAHGKDLLVFYGSGDDYDVSRSAALTKQAIDANLAVRALGYKPYIAPAISSGAYAITALLEGAWQHSAFAYHDIFLGAYNRLSARGVEINRIAYHPHIDKRFKQMMQNLEDTYDAFLAER